MGGSIVEVVVIECGEEVLDSLTVVGILDLVAPEVPPTALLGLEIVLAAILHEHPASDSSLAADKCLHIQIPTAAQAHIKEGKHKFYHGFLYYRVELAGVAN